MKQRSRHGRHSYQRDPPARKVIPALQAHRGRRVSRATLARKGVKGDTGAAAEVLLRQINVTDTATLAITLGVVDMRFPCAGAVPGERYMAFIRKYRLNGATSETAGRPAGYYIVAVDCLVADTINIAHMRPAIALAIPAAKYELFTDIVKVNAS